jgi:AraC-like DNA-binding protein
MATVLQTSDIPQFETVNASPPSTDHISVKLARLLPLYHHPSAGTIRADHFSTPYMWVSDIMWETTNDVELHNCDTPENVNINFFLKGRLDTCFQGIDHELNMRPNFHNIVFSPDGNDVSRISRNQTMNMFHVSLDKEFFISGIGTDDKWSEHIVNEMHHDRPVSGNRNNIGCTPYMLQLIEGIKNCGVSGPMRNLLIQSKLLELLAMQMDQFRETVPMHHNIGYDEAEKLHQLKKYLDNHFLSELNLTQLSRICLLNEFKVKKGFKQLFGTTVFNYLRKLRMEYAGNLLRDCSMSVDEVADVLGYEHSQHFSVAFKKYSGIKPSGFRVSARSSKSHN